MSNSVPTAANQADPILAEHAVAIRAIVAEHAVAMRALRKRTAGDAIEIGRRLTECKPICGHGNWLPWLDREFEWSEDTAERFIQVSALSNQIPQLAEFDVPLSALYLLAAPSTPETARTAIIKRAESGEVIPLFEVKRTINAAKGREQPVKREIIAEPIKATPRPPRKSKSPDPVAVAEAAWDIAAFLNDVGPDSPDEIARKLARLEELEAVARRLEIENVELRSEVEDLRNENAGLREALNEASKKFTKLSDESVAPRDRMPGWLSLIAGCCARAASGHAIALPSPAINSRRPTVTGM